MSVEDHEDRPSLTDTEDDEENNEHKEDFSQFLRNWAIEYNITHTSLNKLLKEMRRRRYGNLPSDCRTLLRTQPKFDIVSLPPGQYAHIGLKRAIVHYLQGCKEIPKNIHLDYNIDGVPISRSSTNSFWLILTKNHFKSAGLCGCCIVASIQTHRLASTR